eukprot:c13373_g1_i1 orf=2-787(-)
MIRSISNVGYKEVSDLAGSHSCRRKSTKPMWLELLLAEKFFAACAKHFCSKKNEKNKFCLDCMSSICQHCALSKDHNLHQLLQIRRYVYHDVIRLHDIQKLLDCSRVQAYTINSARVVFLKERPQPKSSKGLGSSCESCERSLQDAYKFCSVACKVDMSFNTRQAIEGHEMECIECITSTSTTHLSSCEEKLACAIDDENVIHEGHLDLELTASTTSCESTQTDGTSSPSHHNFISNHISSASTSCPITSKHMACAKSRAPR